MTPTTGNPDAVLAVRADERLAHAYEQIARADDQLARVTEQLSRMEHDAARRPVAVPGLPLAQDRPMVRGVIGLVLAAVIGAAAFAVQSPYGEPARLTIARWAPFLTSSPWSAGPANSVQPGPPGVQLASVETGAAQAAQIPGQDAAPAAAPAASELALMLQSMARDIATVEQGIEQLKANQERMAADNARAIEQLRANQEQVTRLAARPSDKLADPGQKAKTPVPAPRPVASAAPKPPPKQPPRAHPQPQPVQLQPQDQ
jgi:predicted FMN-binding regulatory protein PaiB